MPLLRSLMWALLLALAGCACWSALPAQAQAPRVILLVDSGVGWADIATHPMPAQATYAGLSDPAAKEGWSGVATAISAGGRNVGLAALEDPTVRLQHAANGRWYIPRALWRALLAANKAAHADTLPGSLGEAMQAHARVVIVGSRENALIGALIGADRHGGVDAWMPDIAVADTRQLSGAVCIIPSQGGQLGQLAELQALFPHTPIFYVSLTPRAGARDLTPVIWVGDMEGLLASQRTHWNGVVSAGDIAPTLLAAAGLPLTADLRMPARAIAAPQAADTVAGIAACARATERLRYTIATVWGILLAVLAILGVSLTRGLTQPLPTPSSNRTIPLEAWLLAGWAIPVLLVYVFPMVWFLPLPVFALLLLIIWGMAARGLTRLPLVRAWGIASLVGAGALLLTTVTNTVILRQPFLGLTILSGHRYYGIGNEGMGVMLALLTLAVGWGSTLRPAWTGRIIIVTFGLSTLLLAAPWWGANWGGAITALATGLCFLIVHYRRSLCWWTIPLTLVVTIGLACAIVVVLTLLQPVAASHIGALGQAVMLHGWPALSEMIGRKLAFAWDAWEARAGWGICLVGLLFGGFILRQRRMTRGHIVLPPSLRDATVVAWIAAVLGGVLNDSGIALTALMWSTMAPAAVLLTSQRWVTPACPSVPPQCSPHNPG